MDDRAPLHTVCEWPSLRNRAAEMGSLSALGALVNLSHPANTVDWGFIHLSVANVVVIALMFVVFVLAIALPFPGAARRRDGAP